MAAISVLIVDDQHLFAEGLKYVLEGESADRIHVIGIADNGKHAVELTQRMLPDVILMDLRMPVMDGVQATEIIHKSHPDIKILILTTFDDDELAVRALHSGANGFVIKDVEPREIVLAVESVSRGALFVSESVGFRLVDQIKPTKETSKELIKERTAMILSRLPSLSLREAEVLALVFSALRNSDIAEMLFISEKTVKNHISNIYDKLGIHNRLQLISQASKLGIMEDGESH